MKLRLEELHSDPENLRRHGAGEMSDTGLRASIRAVGQLVPLLVRARPGGGFAVIEGHRRLAALQALGLEEAECSITDRPPQQDKAVQAAANMVRAPMDPVDQWRAMVVLRADGYSIEGAADALGLPLRTARKLELLGRLHPPMLDALAGHGLPGEEELADIAQAPPEQQAEAWKAHEPKRGERVNWWKLANALRQRHWYKSDARFDDELARKHGVHWEEDLFAQPDDPEAIFTRDGKAFLAAQREWLEQVQIPGLLAQRYQAVILPTDKHGYGKRPQHAEAVYGSEEKAPKTVVRGYYINPQGRVECQLYKLPKPDKAAEEAAKNGKAADSPAPAETARAESPATSAATKDAADDAPAPPARTTTKEGLRMLAAAKTGALHAHLLDPQRCPRGDVSALVAATLCALAGLNVSITQGSGMNRTKVYLQDLPARLFTPEGQVKLPPQAELMGMLAEALSAILRCDPRDDYRGGSGLAAEWAARILGVACPRVDVEEVLAEASVTVLRAQASLVGVKPNQPGAALARELAGKLPDWHPPGSLWDTTPPEPEGSDDAEAEAA